MFAKWLVIPLIFLLLLGLAQEATKAELIRKKDNKRIVAEVKGAQSVFYIDYGDIAQGQVQSVDKGLLSLEGGATYWFDKESRVLKNRLPVAQDELKKGLWVELAYNKDNKDKENRSYLMRISIQSQKSETTGASGEYARIVLAEPQPNRVSVRFGEDAIAYGPLALVEKGVEEFVRLSDGTALVNEETLTLALTSKNTPKSVELQQGKSKVWGGQLDYDNESGEAVVKGPIDLQRSGDKPLKGEASGMVYNVDDEVLNLWGSVKFEQDGRTTTAQTAVVREKDRVAYLYGTDQTPVRSTNKDGFVEGTKILYNLDKGDVVVLEGVKGELKEN